MPKIPPPLTPRKVPRQLRAEHTVATILEAAALCLESGGLEGLNTNLVAQRAGVSIGSLYQYLPNKDALIVALSLRERAAFYADACGVREIKEGVEALDYLIAVSVKQQLRRPVLSHLLDFEEGRPHSKGACGRIGRADATCLRDLVSPRPAETNGIKRHRA